MGLIQRPISTAFCGRLIMSHPGAAAIGAMAAAGPEKLTESAPSVTN
jgi:hypothetical protein